MRPMTAARTSASSGLMTRSRSVSVLDGAICSSGISSALVGGVYWTRLWWLSSDSSSIRMPVCLSVSIAAQVQNARSSSPDRSRRAPVEGSSLQVLAVGPDRTGARWSTSPRQVNSSPGATACAAASRSPAARAWALTRAVSAGRAGRRSRVRWSIRDLRLRISLTLARSSRRTGDGAAQGPQCGLLHRPLGNVEVEGADLPEFGTPVGTQVMRLDDLSIWARGTADLDEDPLFPGRGDVGGEAQRADPGMVDLQVSPEQPTEGQGQAAQRGVVEGGGAFKEVLVQHLPDGGAFDAVAVEHLLRAEPALGGESPQGGRRIGAEDAHRVKDAVETRATVRAPHPLAALQLLELQAVPDGDVGDEATLGRQDRRSPAQSRLGHRRARPAGLEPGGQVGEAVRIADSGHVRRQAVGGERRQEPVQAGADRVGADQQVQADPQVAGHRHRRPVPHAAGLQPAQRRPPPAGVTQSVGAAGLPAFLPRLARMVGKPLDHRDQPAAPTHPGRLLGERRLQHPGQEQVGVLGGTPRRLERPRRIPAMQLLHVCPGRPRRAGRGRCHGPGLGPMADDHDDRLLNKVSRDSAQ
jgi:hypothetical protein